MVLPGRNPVIVATQLASIDRLSGGRLLPAFGLGIANPHEQQAFGVAREERAPWFNEALPLLRRFWSEPSVDHDGPRFRYRDMRVEPKPHQQPMDIWLGGIAPSELRRGRPARRRLAPFLHSARRSSRGARATVEAAATDAGRTIDPEHFGALIPYTMSTIPDANLAALRARRPRRRPGRDHSGRLRCTRGPDHRIHDQRLFEVRRDSARGTQGLGRASEHGGSRALATPEVSVNLTGGQPPTRLGNDRLTLQSWRNACPAGRVVRQRPDGSDGRSPLPCPRRRRHDRLPAPRCRQAAVGRRRFRGSPAGQDADAAGAASATDLGATPTPVRATWTRLPPTPRRRRHDRS